jgi:hypothetical protein
VALLENAFQSHRLMYKRALIMAIKSIVTLPKYRR